LWSIVVKFSQTYDLQRVLSVGGTLQVRWGGLQSNDAFHWYLTSSGRVNLQHMNVSMAGSGATAGLDILGGSNNIVTSSTITGSRVRMLSNHNDYFGYNNVSNYDDSAHGNYHVLWVGANATVEHNEFWDVTIGTQSVILTYLNWGNTRIFANKIMYRANGNNAMGIEVINIDHLQTAVKPTGYTDIVSWNNITVYYTSGGSNIPTIDNEFSEREWIHNNTVTTSGATVPIGCLQGGGVTHALYENNICRGLFSEGIYEYIDDNTFNTFRSNLVDGARVGVVVQAGNNTFVGNTFLNLTGHGIWECSSSPCAGDNAPTTHNLYVGNTFSWKSGHALVGNLTYMQSTNYLANVFVGHTGPTNPATRYVVDGANNHWNGDWLYWGNASFKSLKWSNNTNGSRCLTATLPSLTAIDCKALSTTLSNTLSVAGPIDQHGSVDLVNNPRQVTVLYKLGRDTSTVSLKTANAGKFWFDVTGDYYGTYRVNIYNYSGSKWENFTTLYTSSSGTGSYSRAMSGFYNVSVVLVNITAGGISVAPAPSPSVLGVTYNPEVQQLDVVFSQPMNRTSVEAAVSIEPFRGVQITWLNDTHLRLQLGSSLATKTVYTLTIGPTARNSGGLAMGDPFRFQFTMTPASGTTPSNPADWFSSIWLLWITLALAGPSLVVFVLYRRSRKQVRVLRQTAGQLTRRIEELRAADLLPAVKKQVSLGVRPVRSVQRPLQEARTRSIRGGDI
jgi:hypothetical protein